MNFNKENQEMTNYINKETINMNYRIISFVSMFNYWKRGRRKKCHKPVFLKFGSLIRIICDALKLFSELHSRQAELYCRGGAWKLIVNQVPQVVMMIR